MYIMCVYACVHVSPISLENPDSYSILAWLALLPCLVLFTFLKAFPGNICLINESLPHEHTSQSLL